MTDFIITYKRRSGESFIEQFSESTQALKERLRREAAIDDPDIEIAHISAPSLESLKSLIPGISWAALKLQIDTPTLTASCALF